MYRGVALILLGPNTVSDFPSGYIGIGINPLPGTQIPWNLAIFVVLAVNEAPASSPKKISDTMRR